MSRSSNCGPIVDRYPEDGARLSSASKRGVEREPWTRRRSVLRQSGRPSRDARRQFTLSAAPYDAGRARFRTAADAPICDPQRPARPIGTPSPARARSCPPHSARAARRSPPGLPPAGRAPGRRGRAGPPPRPAPAAARRCRSGGTPCRPSRAPAACGPRRTAGRAGASAAARRRLRVRSAKRLVLSLSTTPSAARSASRRRRASFSDSRQRCRSSASGAARSVSNVVSALTDFVARRGSTGRSSSPSARRTSAGPSSPSIRRAARASSACKCPSRVMPSPARRRAKAGPMPGSSPTGSPASSAACLGADHAEAARLVPPRGDLGQQPVAREADRDRHADLAAPPAARSGPARPPAGRRAGPRCRRGRAPPRRSTAAARAASGAPSARGSAARRRRIW